MKVKCNYCRQMIDEGLEKCPNCGATITANRMASDQPKTIEELKQWYTDHNLPPEETTRFFIGKDIKEPKAFGIYKNDSGDFVVYKNKSNGERAIRYQGVDEGYAVNELYQRLRSEIADQKEHGSYNKEAGGEKKKFNPLYLLGGIVLLPIIGPIISSVLVVIALIFFCIFDNSPSNGYYNYNGNDYYYQGSSWYEYDADNDDWSYASNGSE